MAQSKQGFIIEHKTIDEIVSSLKQRGLNVSAYGVTEALNAIIQAFEEDGDLKVDKSADFILAVLLKNILTSQMRKY